MPVHIDDLHQALTSLVTVEPTQLAEDNATLVSLLCGQFRAHICFRLIDEAEFGLERGDFQAVGITFTFALENGEEIDLRDKPFLEVVMLCHQLQSMLDWGTLSAYTLPNGCVEIALNRVHSVSEEDIERTMNFDRSAELLTAFDFLTKEFEDVAPIILAYAKDELRSLDNIEQLVEPGIRI